MRDTDAEWRQRLERVEKEIDVIVRRLEAIEETLRALNREVHGLYEEEDFGPPG